MFAHWHVFRRSFDNKPAEADTYASYLSPAGMGGRYRASGGWIRQRPLPRPPKVEADWKVRDFIDDIRVAAACGLDGFQFNIGSIKPDNQLYWVALQDCIAAAERTELPFSIFLSLDCGIIKPDQPADHVAAALATVSKSRSVARSGDGRLMLGAFWAEKWPKAYWEELLQALAARGERVYLAPSFLSPGSALPYFPLADAVSVWGGNRLAQLSELSLVARAARAMGKAWIAPIWPQDFRAKAFFLTEAENSRLYRRGWAEAIEAGADAVLISTWNDYSEGSEIQPSTATQYGFSDLTAYFAAWFKAGRPPEIRRDVLYYFHRIEATDAPLTGSDQPQRFAFRFSEPRNEIELLAFLTQASRLEIETSARTVTGDAPPGVSSIHAPLAPGRPRFRAVRGGTTVAAVESAFPIREASTYQNLLYHSGSSSRPPVGIHAPGANGVGCIRGVIPGC